MNIDHLFITFCFQWNEYLWNNTVMNNAKFESVIILSMEKPENKSLRGVVISGILQFASDISEESYLSVWNEITNNSNILGNWKIKDSELQSESQCEFMQKIIAFIHAFSVNMKKNREFVEESHIEFYVKSLTIASLN